MGKRGASEELLLEINGIQILVQRKQIRNLYVYVKRPEGQILVSAPRWIEEKEIRQFLTKKWDWIQKNQRKIAMEKKALVPFSEKEREVWKQNAKEKLSQLVPLFLEKWEPVMGVYAAQWRLKDMKTRWGSCNVKEKRLWFSLALWEKPVDCVEYVVVHELCHLLEPSHNQVFKGYMTQFLPDWKERRKHLNES